MPGASSCPCPPGQHLSHSPNPRPLVSQNTACCPANWLEHEGRCYWFSSLGKPWPEAEKDCQLKNAHLVVINSREEQVSPPSSGPKTGLIGITWGSFNNHCHLSQILRGSIGPSIGINTLNLLHGFNEPMKFRTASPRSWPGGTGSGESPLSFCHPRILSRPTYVLTSPVWASVIQMESGNGWMGRTMRPTSSECLGFLCLFPPSALLLQGLTHSPFSPAWILFHLFFLAGCFPLTNPPPPSGIGSQASQMTFMGMSWVGVRTVPISTLMVNDACQRLYH